MAIIVGGQSAGVEMWNPDTGAVSLLMDLHPAETPGNGIRFAQMHSVHGILKLVTLLQVWNLLACG